MADYFTHFSCVLQVGSAENAAAAELIRKKLAQEIDREEHSALGFDMDMDREAGPDKLLISSPGYGDPEHVIKFVLRCAEAFGLKGRWGFCWAYTCSRLRFDGFGGGTHVLDLGTRESVADVDCSDFLAREIAREPTNGLEVAS